MEALLWGKLSGDGHRAHPLLFHLLDTGHVACALLRAVGTPIENWLTESLGLGARELAQFVGLLASCHDMGKATPAFQKKAKSVAPHIYEPIRDVLGGLKWPDAATPHGQLGLPPLSKAFEQWGMPNSAAPAYARVTTGHHGDLRIQRKPRSTALGPESWNDVRERLFQRLADHWQLPACPTELTDEPGFDVLIVLAGLISVADWIASATEHFPPAGMDVDSAEYVTGLAQRASAAVERAGWLQWRADDAPGFRELFGFEPNALQRQTAQLAPDLTCPSLVIIEAPMGLGKTEAAFHLVAAAAKRWNLRGAYVALPTQATSNQMFDRFRRFLEQQDATGQANLLLTHGQSIWNRQFAELQDADAHDSVVAREWFLASKRRLLAQFGVGTIDQSLLGILCTRHFFVRLFGLAGKVVILDEVHAYDTFTSTHLDHLLHWLRHLGCTVILLSATLPKARRMGLLRAFGAEPVETEASYPRITVACDGVSSTPVELSETREIAVTTLTRDAEDVADRLVSQVRRGGCAAWICNTVDRAQDVYRLIAARLEGVDCELSLLHARFCQEDRNRREEQLIDRFGKPGWSEGTRPNRAILVATQVVEQSLDLDFDLMVTDLAPVDLVLQRAGRLHRHRPSNDLPVSRPQHMARAQLWITVPEAEGDGPPDFGVDACVYDQCILMRSSLTLTASDLDRIRLPDDVEALIESVYAPESRDGLPESWRAALRAAESNRDRDEQCDWWDAAKWHIPAPDARDPFLELSGRAVRGDEDQFAGNAGATRKTRQNVRVVCLHRLQGRLYVDAEGRHPIDLDAKPDLVATRRLLGRTVSLSRPALVRHLRDVATPPGWRNAALLRHFKPLIFKAGRARAAGQTIRIDDELGIVFEERESQDDD